MSINLKTILSIGFSNGYTGHADAKLEIVTGGNYGREFLVRTGNAGAPNMVIHRNPDTTQWEQVRDNFAVQLTDGKIALYAADSNGIKGDVIVEWNDDTIVKSHYDTLTMTGGYGGTGNVRVKGVCCSQHLDHQGSYSNQYNHQPVDNGTADQKDYFHIMAPGFPRDLNQVFEIDTGNMKFQCKIYSKEIVNQTEISV